MPATYDRPPYYDDYNRDKNFVQILAVPGRAEQAREFTQLGTMTMDFMGRLGDALFSNGTIIDGCTLVINDKKAIISSGRIYLEGLVRIVNGAELDIDAVGTEVIGAKVKSYLITENEDETLRDPAQGFENYGQEGAHRRKEVVEFTVNDEESATIFILNNGVLLNDNTTSDDTLWLETLARRTYDENGSYKVRGLELHDRNEHDSEGIYASVSEGKAYILGYEVTKRTATRLRFDYATTTRQVSSEPKTYSSTQTQYLLNNQPVKELTQVVCVVQATDQLTRGNIAGGIDYMKNSPVVEIIEVRAGDKIYVQGTDYQLTNDGVDWSLRGDDPATGSTYYVTYNYNKQMKDTDVQLAKDADGNDVLEFVEGGDKPIQNSRILISYLFYLSRMDLITMDRYGAFTIYKGTPDIDSLVESPLNQDGTQLIIGTAKISANESTITLNTDDTTRLDQASLHDLKKRVDDIEYNTAMSDLDQEAADGEDATKLRGIFTDGFIGLTKADATHKDWNCSIDLDLAELTLPFNVLINTAEVNNGTYDTNISKMGNVYMAPFEHKLAFQQKFATEYMLVNPYAVYQPMSLIQLNPAVDNWIDSSTIVVNQSKTVSTTLRRWWYHRGESWAAAERAKWIATTGTTGEQLGYSNYSGTTTTRTSNVVLDDAVMYMRQTTVEASGSNFYPESDNIQCYFNDTLVPLTPTGETEAGTIEGSVKANDKGKFTAKFKVLPNTPCGAVDVKFKNAFSEGSAVYTAQGRNRVIQETVLTTRVVVNTQDPLAQSFSFDADTILTKIGLYFASKDENKNIVVQVRDMVNGYPGTTVYAETVVEAENVIVSGDSSKATEVIFNQPVYCHANTQYCIAILSDSNLYSMWIATLGGTDILTGKIVVSQPYTAGVLFSSSNAMTWTAHQTSDLKIDLYRANFTGKGVIIFNDVNTTQIDRILLAAESIDYKNIGINWYYRTASDSSWLPLDTYVDRELNELATNIQIKVEMEVDYSTSPILAGDCINLIGFIDKTEGCYLSRTVTMDDYFNTIALSVEVCNPSGTAFTISYSTDNETWTALDNSEAQVTAIDEEFARYEYKVSVERTKTYKVKIEMATSNPLVKIRFRKLINILRNE